MKFRSAQETILLNILQKKAKPGVSLSYRIPVEPNEGPFATDMLSFSTGKGRFQFDFHIKTNIGLTEHLFPYDVARDAEKLEKQATALMKAQIENVIKKIQKHRIDPIGLGLYARAFHYNEFKNVEDRWGEAVADATFHVKVDLTIGAIGPVK